MSTQIVVTDNYTWTNEHNNVTKQILHRFQVFNSQGNGWKDGLAGIQEMLGRVQARSERVRSYGGKWSLSDAAVCSDSMHDTKPLTFWGSVGQNSIVGKPLYEDPMPLQNRLFYFQSGSQVNQINNVLEARGCCLPTTGASNGQTIAGAVSTGTHGSALNIGAMQDYVRALHIVTSAQEHVIIQPASNPIVNTTFSDVFGAKLLTDDNLFYSAVVSFGSFGVIHAMIVETVSLFMLETYTQRVDYTKAATVYPYLTKFDHSSTTNLATFLQQFGLPSQEDPYHLDIIGNPYAATQNAFLRVMYKRPYDKTKLSPEPGVSDTRVGNDILSIIGTLTNVAAPLVPTIVNQLFGKAATVQSGYTQTPRNIFGDSTIYQPKNGGASTELGVPIAHAADAVALVMQLATQSVFAGLMGIRFMKNSAATLAFTRFAPLTCTIELPGLNCSGTQDFYNLVYSSMDKAGIPFTLHWGQEGDYSAARLHSMYGSAVNTWVEARNQLLPTSAQQYMFTNDFLKRLGLGESANLTGGNVIA
jgi:hypothetical protein